MEMHVLSFVYFGGSILFLVSLAIRPEEDLYTSSARLELLLKDERIILTTYIDYLQEKQKELRDMEGYFSERLRRVQARGEETRDLNHPNDQHNVIKDFLQTYRSRLEKYAKSIKIPEIKDKKRTVHLPTTRDAHGAMNALLLIGEVYKLNASDMTMGNYSGSIGPALHYEDAFKVGQEAFMDSKVGESVQWLIASLEAFQNSSSTEESDWSSDPTEDGEDRLSVGSIKALLGRAYLLQGNIEKARSIHDELKNTSFAGLPDVVELRSELEEGVDNQEADFNGDDNHNVLCMGKSDGNAPGVIDPRITCRYKSGFLPYYRFKEEVISLRPHVSVYYNFSTNRESEDIKNYAKSRLIRAQLAKNVADDNDDGTSEIRTGQLTWLADKDLPTAHSLSARIEQLTRLKVTEERAPGTELMQVVNYGIGGQYDYHVDADDSVRPSQIYSRLATFIMYLNDVALGGATTFEKVAITVRAEKNKALLFYNYDPALNSDFMTLHSGCPVAVGQKWIANKWLHLEDNMFTRRCGRNEEDSHLDVEPWMDHRRVLGIHLDRDI